MNLDNATTKELRAELHRREEAERLDRWQAICKEYPCPKCGADPTNVETQAIEEFRFAPRDADGRPMLHASYDSEQGTTAGIRYRVTVICENGHITEHEDMRWFDEPRKGPPLLRGREFGGEA